MGLLKLHSLLLLLYLFLPLTMAATNCSSTCGNQTIRFPFRLSKSPSACGYPGFNLACKANQTALSLPGSGDFLVREINYTTQSIRVFDPGNCLSKRLLGGLNLSGSPFMAVFSANYTLFSCPKEFDGLGFHVIDCLGNSTRSVLAILNGTSVDSMVARSCQKMDHSLMVSGGSSPGFFKGDVLELRWDSPPCQDCQGGSTEASPNDHTFKIVALSITLPIMACSVAICIFLSTLDRRNTDNMLQHPQLAPTKGLDQATIDSYTTVVLGESKRVPGLNSDTCLVCLSDYIPKETLRCLPECQHCFHANCIDEWLRIKGTCPICRNPPSIHECS